jgi:hypothetical protein
MRCDQAHSQRIQKGNDCRLVAHYALTEREIFDNLLTAWESIDQFFFLHHLFVLMSVRSFEIEINFCSIN